MLGGMHRPPHEKCAQPYVRVGKQLSMWVARQLFSSSCSAFTIGSDDFWSSLLRGATDVVDWRRLVLRRPKHLTEVPGLWDRVDRA